MKSNLFNDDLQRFLHWLDEQIEPALKGEDTPLTYLITDILHKQTIFSCIEDAICYLLVETFASNEDIVCFDFLQLRYERTLTNDEISELLLKIPIRYVMLLLK